MCTVMNLSTLEKILYTCSPKEAVIAAYAQSQNDYNTWEYEEKYASLVKEGKNNYLCVNFAVFKDGRE